MHGCLLPQEAVIDTIVAKVQGVPGDDRCVLLVGYKEQMETMMREANPGLARRFQLSQAWTFEDYSNDQLLTIIRERAAKRWELQHCSGTTSLSTELTFQILPLQHCWHNCTQLDCARAPYW